MASTPPPVIPKNAVYTVESATEALGLAPSCLPREIRLRRLRASRRGGRYFILGSWLLAWIASGSTTHRRKRHATANGRAD
jgi:hypothetical protein